MSCERRSHWGSVFFGTSRHVAAWAQWLWSCCYHGAQPYMVQASPISILVYPTSQSTMHCWQLDARQLCLRPAAAHPMRSLRMSMHTACTAMLRFSPRLSTFSCVFACTSMSRHLRMLTSTQVALAASTHGMPYYTTHSPCHKVHHAGCTLMLTVLGCASSSWHRFSRMRSLWGDNLGRCKMMVASRLPNS